MLITLISLRTLLLGGLLVMTTVTSVRSNAVRPADPFHYRSGPGNDTRSSAEDRIIGRWYFPKRESDIEIYRQNGHYFGKIVAVSQATTDEYGTMSNKMLLTDLTFAKNEWSGGQLIHPQTGNRFDVYLKLMDANTLVITAYKGCRLFSKAYTLTRI